MSGFTLENTRDATHYGFNTNKSQHWFYERSISSYVAICDDASRLTQDGTHTAADHEIKLSRPIGERKEDWTKGGYVQYAQQAKPVMPFEVALAMSDAANAKDKKSAFDSQVGGTHYKELGVQPMDLTYANLGYEAFVGACYTKINKYMIRKKDDEVEQLKKARHVLDMWIEKAELEQAK